MDELLGAVLSFLTAAISSDKVSKKTRIASLICLSLLFAALSAGGFLIANGSKLMICFSVLLALLIPVIVIVSVRDMRKGK